MRAAALAAAVAALAPIAASASEARRCEVFVDESGAFELGEAYKAADLVAIGKVRRGEGLTLEIGARVKGSEKRAAVPLTVPRCAGTACEGGFSVAPDVDLLFLLKRLPDGLYDGVAGGGNYPCPVVYEVRGGEVVLGTRKVKLAGLKRYLESRPAPVRP